jgi:hypothetical protein
MDYQEIINGLTTEGIINLMTQLGSDEYKETESYVCFKTICHNVNVEEASMKLYYYKDNHFFYCYTECGGMSIFKFLEHYYKSRQIEYNWYTDIYEVICNCSTYRAKEQTFVKVYTPIRDKYQQKEVKKLKIYSPGVLDVFVKQYTPEWLSDGITKEAMDKFNIRYSISQNKIIIPHYDGYGNLVGIRGRALNDWEIENVGKYMPVQIENTWYSHPLSLNLYGLYENKENIKERGICFICESEKAVLQAESFSFPNCCVAVCGSTLNKFALRLLRQLCQPVEIVICFDQEELPGESKYFNKLYKLCQKYGQWCNFSFVYDREGLLNLKDSPTDKGEEVFKKLLDKRVRVI